MKNVSRKLNDSEITFELNMLDFKYLSVRFLYKNWFFAVGAEVACQLLDATIKLYLSSIKRYDLFDSIRSWGGNKSHNLDEIISFIDTELTLNVNLDQKQKKVLGNIHGIYRCRYVEELALVNAVETYGKDIHTIDFIYKFFRDRIPSNLRVETLIEKVLLRQNFYWGADNNINLTELLREENEAFQ